MCAAILGLASGYAAGADGRVDPAIAAGIIRGALADAALDVHAIDAVSTGASGSVRGDDVEARALSLAFAGRIQPVPAMAVKASVGESLGAAGAMQMAAMLAAMREGVLPGVAGLGRTIVDPARVAIGAAARTNGRRRRSRRSQTRALATRAAALRSARPPRWSFSRPRTSPARAARRFVP